jgi:polysaccharide pyruvyl transferase WcaK-like protein
MMSCPQRVQSAQFVFHSDLLRLDRVLLSKKLEVKVPWGSKRKRRIVLFGHFGGDNFGNECTLQAVLYRLRSAAPSAEITCICTHPQFVASNYKVAAVPISGIVVKPWNVRNPIIRFLRRILVGIPSETYRWVKGFKTLRDAEALIVPGTGLLTDVYCLFDWGPYGVFRWSVIAKLCRCKLIFLSVGVGPIQSRRGKALIRAALMLADFRSYRDEATKQYVSALGVQTGRDAVSPDLAFSLPKEVLPPSSSSSGPRPIIGIGLMHYRGEFGDQGNPSYYSGYFEVLRRFVNWLLTRGYDVALLTGDLCDVAALQHFTESLKRDSGGEVNGQVIERPFTSVEDLLEQLAATDAVIATRFHNVLLALLLNKPTISIVVHQKSASLMSEMGLSEYCQKFEDLNIDKLVAQFRSLEKNACTLKMQIKQKTEEFRHAADNQGEFICKMLNLNKDEPDLSESGYLTQRDSNLGRAQRKARASTLD